MWEADRKHAETVIKCAGVENGNGITRYKSQSVIALSSGEAKLYAAVLARSMGIGTQQLYQNLGVDLKIQVLMDAIAGIGMMRRQGLGNEKHIET